MEQKNNKGLIWLTVLLIILFIGLISLVVFNTMLKQNEGNTNIDNSTTTTTTTTTEKKAEDIINYDYAIEKNNCIITNDNVSYEKSYKINVKYDNLKYTYFSDNKTYLKNEYINDNLIQSEPNTEMILSKVCYYDNYFMTIEGWEGTPTLKLIDKEGKIVYKKVVNSEYKNGLLELDEITETENEKQFIHKKINIDLSLNEIIEKVIKEEKFTCEEIYTENPDNLTAEETTKWLFCYGP